jgi:hypothetical protein
MKPKNGITILKYFLHAPIIRRRPYQGLVRKTAFASPVRRRRLPPDQAARITLSRSGGFPLRNKGGGDFDGRDSAAKDTKPKGFSP